MKARHDDLDRFRTVVGCIIFGGAIVAVAIAIVLGWAP